LARLLKEKGKKVLLIDADPDMNAGTILGVPGNISITPIIELKELIAERTGTEVGKSAPFFKMNPKVDDIPEKYCVDHRGIKLLVMGTIRRGGGGCACPENAFLKTLLSHLIINREEWVLLDMEAGIEHLGRGTALGVDTMVVIVEASQTSIETAFRIKNLSRDLGIKNLAVVGNKIQSPEQRDFLKERLKDFNLLGFLDYSPEVTRINMGEATVFDVSGEAIEQMDRLIQASGWMSLND
ncbi:MAG TPA: carbon monoxide dehydrogenase, partial [Spirochaetia bacterium]|nr:carbon monoxide dehydrogenase [Spirochaetia bacterium]